MRLFGACHFTRRHGLGVVAAVMLIWGQMPPGAKAQTSPLGNLTQPDAHEGKSASAKNDAVVVEMRIPAVVMTGQVFTAGIVMSNSGSGAWTADAVIGPPYCLWTQNPLENHLWRESIQVNLPRSVVKPGETVEFQLDCLAPPEPGPCPLAWRMAQTSGPFFGETARRTIWVTTAAVPETSRTTPHYISRSWTQPDGLPHNHVQAILQTRDGYLWVGTRKGVARFDGARFAVMDDGGWLKAASIRALCEDTEGRLWVGTDNLGVARQDGGGWSWFTVTNGLAANAVRSICATHDGAIWIGTTNGLDRFQNGRFQHWGVAEGLADKH